MRAAPKVPERDPRNWSTVTGIIPSPLGKESHAGGSQQGNLTTVVVSEGISNQNFAYGEMRVKGEQDQYEYGDAQDQNTSGGETFVSAVTAEGHGQ
jgi:hypothetical protein